MPLYRTVFVQAESLTGNRFAKACSMGNTEVYVRWKRESDRQRPFGSKGPGKKKESRLSKLPAFLFSAFLSDQQFFDILFDFNGRDREAGFELVETAILLEMAVIGQHRQDVFALE